MSNSGFGNVSFNGVQALSPVGSGDAFSGTSIDPITGNIILGDTVGGIAGPAAFVYTQFAHLNGNNFTFQQGSPLDMELTFGGVASMVISQDNSIKPHIRLVDRVLGDATEMRRSTTAFTIVNSPSSQTLHFTETGLLGIDVIPTARIHPAAGLAAANGAPFKYNAGVLAQTVVEDGAKNFDGNNESLAVIGVTYILAKTLTATAVLDFPNTVAGASSDLTIALTGAADGDAVILGVPIASQVANGTFSAFVSAAGVVTVRYANNDLVLPFDPASGTFRIAIVKY